MEGEGEILDPVVGHAAPRRLPHHHGKGVHVYPSEGLEQLHVHARRKKKGGQESRVLSRLLIYPVEI